jgi:hypothetical protein
MKAWSTCSKHNCNSSSSSSSDECCTDRTEEKDRFKVYLSYQQELVLDEQTDTFIPAPFSPYVGNISARFELEFEKDFSSAAYKLFVFNASDKITDAHIHAGHSKINGPVVVDLYNPPTGSSFFNGLLAQGTIKNADIKPEQGYNTVASLYLGILRNDLYVNVHSEHLPGGIARGQIFSTSYTD